MLRPVAVNYLILYENSDFLWIPKMIKIYQYWIFPRCFY